MGNIAPRLDGSFIERSGRIWTSSQSGNTFRWIQDGTGRVANGIAVPMNGGLSWTVLITFDGNTHWKLSPSLDGSQLIGPSDVFTRMTTPSVAVMSPATSVITDVPPLAGAAFTENSGKQWSCLMHEGGYFVLQNQSDARKCEGYVVRDPAKYSYVVYLIFHNNGSDTTMRVETNDMSCLVLPNGDVFRRNNVNSTTFVPYNTGNVYPPQMTQPPTYPGVPPPYQQPSSYQSQPYQNQQPPVYQNQPQFYPQPQVQTYQQQQMITPNVPQSRILRIGGGKDGVTTWTRWNGNATNSSVDGWEMKFKVDQYGNVSGSNKNDNNDAITKHYSGTFINNVMNVTVTWDDGRGATYKGSVVGNKARLDFVITSAGTQGGRVGDCGINTGTLFETFEDPNVKNYKIGGKTDGVTLWTKWNGQASNSSVAGWEMKFQVDQYGNISGSNKNDGSSITKYYTGTLKGNSMDAKVTWDDGRSATYKGTITGISARLDFVITAVGTQGGRVGDCGVNTGTILQI